MTRPASAIVLTVLLAYQALPVGVHEIAVAFLNDAVIDREDRNLYLDRLTIIPPAGAAEPSLAAKQELAKAAQADYAVKFYRVCFAHPSMRAITWWDLCDQGSWLPGGGMLRFLIERLQQTACMELPSRVRAAPNTSMRGWAS